MPRGSHPLPDNGKESKDGSCGPVASNPKINRDGQEQHASGDLDNKTT
jgi:hypothetical protein